MNGRPTNRQDRRRERKRERADFMRAHRRRNNTRPLIRDGRYFCPLCSGPVTKLVFHPVNPELARVECAPCEWTSDYGTAVRKEPMP